MKNIINKLNFNFSRKNNFAQTISMVDFIRDPKWSEKNYSSIAKESFMKNIVAYRAITLIAQSAASVPWRLHKISNNKKIEIKHHPILDLLHKPNSRIAGAEFFEFIYSYKMISGNAYILAVGEKHPEELHILRPDAVQVVIEDGVLKGYSYNNGEGEVFYPINNLTGMSRILHIKNFHPLDEIYGMSPIHAAQTSIDQHNQLSAWNQSLLQNGARPSGAIIVKSQNGSYTGLTDNQFERLKEEIDHNYTSAANAGRPLLLEGGLEWQELSLSPKDMDFIEGKNSAARDIALALGVPPQLMGLPGDSTYNNMQEARLALWEETIVPLLDRTIDSLNNWLIPMFDQTLKISYDVDEINGLAMKREKIWSRIENTSFLTINEKRQMVGLSPVEGGDKLI